MNQSLEGQTIEDNTIFEQLITKSSGKRPETDTNAGVNLLEILDREHDELMMMSRVAGGNSNLG